MAVARGQSKRVVVAPSCHGDVLENPQPVP
jgi:hypothetical protein